MRRAVRNIGATVGAVTLVTALAVGASVPAFAAASANSTAAKKPAVLTAVLKRPSGHPVAGQKLTITFKGTHAAAKGHIVKYTFVAGDKSKAVSGKKVPASLTHTWGRAGTYKMSLTVTDSNHKTVTMKQSIVLLTPHLAGGGAVGFGSTSVDAPQVCQPADAADTTPGSGNGTQLSGTITDPSGHPLSGIPVTLGVAGDVTVPWNTLLAGIPFLDTLNIPGDLSIPNITNTVRTDANGNYSLDALPLSWVPDFTIPGFPTLFLGQGSVAAGPLRNAILALLINPQMAVNTGAGANPNYTQATPDRAGRGLTGVKLPSINKNFVLQPAGNISGHLVTASGAPVAGQQIEFVGSGVTFAVTSAADGSYSMPSVPLGLASLHEVTAFGAPVAPVIQGTLDSCIHDVTGLNVIAA